MPARKVSGTAPPKAPLFDAAMAFEEARRSSFKTTAPHKWPHPTNSRSKSAAFPTPDALARVGLYFDAEASSSGAGKSGKGKAKGDQAMDVCTHYICGTQVAGWRAGDDPIARLRDENPTCPSVLLHDSVEGQVARDAWAKEGEKGAAPEFVWTEETLLPTSEAMMEARLLTFGNLWPYDKKKGWKPTSVQLAAAGFFFDPMEDSEDNATCVYCKRALGGWEKGDDPIEEHRRRTKDSPCPFFNCKLDGPNGDEETAPEEAGADIHQEEETQACSGDEGEKAQAGTSRKRGRKGKEADSSKGSASATRKASTRRGKTAVDETAEALAEEQADVAAKTEMPKRTEETASSRASPRPRGKKTQLREEDLASQQAESDAEDKETIAGNADKTEAKTPSSPKSSIAAKRKMHKVQDEAIVPARASSRHAARAASQSIRANLEEERIGAITRPKHPELMSTVAPEPAVVQEKTDVVKDEDAGESTTIEHPEEEQVETAPWSRSAPIRQSKKSVQASQAIETAIAETGQDQEEGSQSKQGAGSKTHRKGKGKPATSDIEDSERVHQTDEEGDKAREVEEASTDVIPGRTTRSRVASSSAPGTSDSSSARSTRARQPSSIKQSSSLNSEEKPNEEAAWQEAASSQSSKGRAASSSGKSRPQLSSSYDTVNSSSSASSRGARAVSTSKTARQQAMLMSEPLGESSAINSEPPKVSTPLRNMRGVDGVLLMNKGNTNTMLKELEKLKLTEEEKKLTVGKYLDQYGERKLNEMRQEGLNKIKAVEENFRNSRAQIEAILRSRK